MPESAFGNTAARLAHIVNKERERGALLVEYVAWQRQSPLLVP